MATAAPTRTDIFTAFTPEAIQFLVDLADNNERGWFNPHKAEYERLLKRPLEALCVDLAAEFDRKIVIEAAVPKAREIEVAVLGNDDPEASVPGEIIPSGEFYDYNAKYVSDDSRTVIPAQIDEARTQEVRALAIAAFKAIDGAGMARVDFLLAGDSQVLYLNEVNTIPGFTTISMYSKMWEATGLTYSALVDQLIQLALERHAQKTLLKTSAL